MKQSGHLNPSEETGTGCPVSSKYGRTPPNKHGGVGRQQQQQQQHNTSIEQEMFFVQYVINGEIKVKYVATQSVGIPDSSSLYSEMKKKSF